MLRSLVRQRIPRNVWILGVVSLLTDITSKMILSLLPLFLVSVLGANLVSVGVIEGIAESTASVLKVFSGALSDYWQRRKELAIVGYGLSALATPLFALASSPTWVLAARFIDRVGKGIRVSPRNALVADATPPEQRGAAYGLRQSLDTIGAFSGPLLATALMLAFEQNFQLVFWLAAAPAIFGVVLLCVGLKEPSGHRCASRNQLQWSALKSLSKNYWTLVLVALLFNLGNSSDAFLLLRVQQVGIDTALIPLSFGVINITYFCSAYPVGVLSDRIGRLKLLVGGFLLFAIVYLGFALAQAVWQIWLLFGLYGLYLGMSQGVLLAIVSEQVPAALRGTAFGLINLVAGVVLLPASLLAGALWQYVSFQATFVVGSVFAIVSALLLIFLFRED